MVDDDLQNFLFKYGIDTTTNFDLKNIAKDLGMRIKVLMSDEFLKENTKKEMIILNLESSKERGTHWVCLFKNKYYFDPYGILPMKNLPCETYNTLQIQPDNTKMCGQLCLYILYHLSKVGREKFEELILTTYQEIQDLQSSKIKYKK